MPAPKKYPDELRERAVRLVAESGRPIAHVANDLGVHREALRQWVRQAEADAGTRRDLLTSDERERLKSLEREVREAPQGQRDPQGRLGVFRQGTRSDPTEVSAFIDAHRERFGVEFICETLDVSASAYYQRATGERSARSVEDERLLQRIRAVHAANYEAYGYRRTWKALLRAGEHAPRCQVQRLMREHAIQGAKRRGRPWRTTGL
jgi:transposase